jgi:hypothetical protein
MAQRRDQIFDIRRLESRLLRGRIPVMESSTVIRFADRQTRESRISRARAARRRLEEVEPQQGVRAPGRAWINGLEVGGGDSRFEHLSVFHD